MTMENLGGSLNSTRLSLEIANLPLTPFGMSHRIRNKKKNTANSPNANKLSLKTLKSPQRNFEGNTKKHHKENEPRASTSNGRQCRQILPSAAPSAISDCGTRQECFSHISHTNLPTVYEDDDSQTNRSMEDHESSSIKNGIKCFSKERQATKETSDTGSQRKDSFFTDIDDGSFVEFFQGKKQCNPACENIDQSRNTHQLYYTCGSQNDTVFSTSTKTKTAHVGFRRFVEKIKNERILHCISEDNQDRVPEPQSIRHFPLDESIIAGSADFFRRAKNKIPVNKAINSTMIMRPSDSHSMHDLPLPEISSLTIQSCSESRKSIPDSSPNLASNNKRKVTKTVVKSSSSDDEGSSGDIRQNNNNNNKESVGKDSTNKNTVECRSDNVGLPYLKNREQALKLSGLGKQGYSVAKDYTLISEDVSVINSDANQNVSSKHIHESCSQQTESSKVNDESWPRKGRQGSHNDTDSEIVEGSSDEPTQYIPNDAKSPEVAKWVLTSPFKEGSYASSFLEKHDTLDCSETPSQPKFRLVKETVSRPFSHHSPDKHIYFSSGKIEGPNVAKWIMTSPFKDGSYDSSFLQHENCSSVSDTPSQTKRKDNYESDESCERSLYVRLAERLRTVSNEPVLQSLLGNRKDDNKESNSSDSESSEDVIRRRKSRRARVQRIIVSESDDSSDSSVENDMSSPRNVHSKHEIPYIKERNRKSDALVSEESESLYLRLSDGQSKSLHTIGKDAVSPKAMKNIVTSNVYVKKPANSPIKRTDIITRLILADTEEGSDDLLSESDVSLPDINVENGLSEKKISIVKNYEYVTSDDESFVDRHRPLMQSNRNDHADQVSKSPKLSDVKNIKESAFISPKARRKKKANPSYCPSSESGSDSSFEVYLKSVKKQIQDEKIKKSFKLNDDQDVVDFINDEESDDGVSFYLPSLSKPSKKYIVPGRNLDLKSSGSITEDLGSRRRNYERLDINGEFSRDPETIISPSTSARNVKAKSVVANTNSWRNSVIVDISSDSDSDDSFPHRKPVKKSKPPAAFITPHTKIHPSVKARTEGHNRQVSRKLECDTASNSTPTLTFLASLSANVHAGRCHPDAHPFVKSFKKRKEELCGKLYEFFNKYVFDGKLPAEMNMKWNPRMTKTAGFCYYQTDRSKPSGRGARIELSSKVIDVPERLRDTLIHEMCHAAAWVISGYKDGHGPLWKSWAAKARSAFPELPAITTCHSYQISCKYTYRCTVCSYSIGRHSKSLDTESKVCGYCYGKFELVVNSQGKGTSFGNSRTPASHVNPKTPRTPGAFALFVKENYKTVKSSKQNLKHAEVMRLLSAEFGKMKTNCT